MRRKFINPYLWLCFLPLELMWIWCCYVSTGNLQILAIITTVIGIIVINYIGLKKMY